MGFVARVTVVRVMRVSVQRLLAWRTWDFDEEHLIRGHEVKWSNVLEHEWCCELLIALSVLSWEKGLSQGYMPEKLNHRHKYLHGRILTRQC